MPDWRNFGVMLRTLLGANGLLAVLALIQAPEWGDWLARYLELAALAEPVLLLSLAVLALLRDGLWRMPHWLAQGLVIVIVVAVTASLLMYARSLGLLETRGIDKAMVLAGVLAAAVLAYFAARARGVSPALAEARLAALNARIRPHFLFNSLNAVLSLVRAQPQRAEMALEALADLFRAALRDPGEQVPLSEEIALARQYLDLEKLRLGERLAVDWQIDTVPGEIPIPPLLLQPLLENAVYHGIEPQVAGGVIHIRICREGKELVIEIRNPDAPSSSHPEGHHMALANIRERLSLYYDLEARLECRRQAGDYEVKVVLPCRSLKS